MRIYGIDFTSSPKRSKPITCLACELVGDRLKAGELSEWTGFEGFEAFLKRPGPWIAGMDFPFGQARRFIENIGWPKRWKDYVAHVGKMDKNAFRSAIDDYAASRPYGDKEHKRKTDIVAGSISPQKIRFTPVGLMFFEGAPRLLQAGVSIPHLHEGDPKRIVVEAYPGVLARRLIGKRSYKHDTKKKQTPDRQQAREDLLRTITNNGVYTTHGIKVEAPMSLTNDPGADHLDALLCAIQAAWAWTQRDNRYGAPNPADPLEGWIAQPKISQT